MKSDTPNLLLYLKQLSKPISSGVLISNLLYLPFAVRPQRVVLYIVLCVYVCASTHADPVVILFVPGVEFGWIFTYVQCDARVV